MLQALGITAATLALPTGARADLLSWFKGNDRPKAPPGKALEFSKPAAWQAQLAMTPEDKVTGYNNFYEFGLDKADPAANAGGLKTEGWKVRIDGEVAKPITLDIDDLMKRFPLEQRIYRMRCVEAWSMVVPWIGFELGKLLAGRAEQQRALRGLPDAVRSGADARPERSLYRWRPEVPLRRRAAAGRGDAPAGVADRRRVRQNPAAAKRRAAAADHTVEIRLQRHQIDRAYPFGARSAADHLEPIRAERVRFYANVNPHVDHPRWSQATERFIGSGGILDVKRQPTLLFNGYADQVASLYRGMDLRENF